MELSAAEEDRGIIGDLQWENIRYQGQEKLDTDNQYFRMSSFYSTERSRSDLKADYLRDSAVTNDDIEEVGTAVNAERRIRLTVNPSWTYQLTEVVDAGLSYKYYNLDRKKTGETKDIKYSINEASGFLTRDFSENSQGTVAASYSDYQAHDTNFDMNIFTTSSQLQHAFSDTVNGSLLIGIRYADATNGHNTKGGSDTGVLVNADLQKRFKRTRIRLKYVRDFYYPTSYLGLVEQDLVSLKATSDFTNELHGMVGLIYLDQDTVFTNSTPRASKTYRVVTHLRRQLTDELNVALNYRFTLKDRKHDNDNAESNAVFITLEYNFGDFNF